MLCYRCGTNVPENVDTCTSCGQKFAGRGKPLSSTGKARLIEKYKDGLKKTYPGMIYDARAVIDDRYVLEEVIGSGGLGVLYRAYDRVIDVRVALKVICPKIIHTSDEERHFTKYLKSAKHLSHPNIIQIYETGSFEGNHYIVMQFVEGLPLNKILALRKEKGESLGLDELEPIIVQIAQALDAAHKSTYHGDLKPDNVLIQPDFLKITDFCFDRAIPHKPFIAMQKAKRGKIAYIAPEIRTGSGRGDARSDIYSLGVILGELLCSELYMGMDGELAGYRTKLSKGLSDIFVRAVQPDSRRRYNSAGEIAEDVISVIHGEEPPARALTQAAVDVPPPLPSERVEADEEDLDAAYILGVPPVREESEKKTAPVQAAAQPVLIEETPVSFPAEEPPTMVAASAAPSSDVHKLETRITVTGGRPAGEGADAARALSEAQAAPKLELPEGPQAWQRQEMEVAPPECEPAPRRGSPFMSIFIACVAVLALAGGAFFAFKQFNVKGTGPAASSEGEAGSPSSGQAVVPPPQKEAKQKAAAPVNADAGVKAAQAEAATPRPAPDKTAEKPAEQKEKPKETAVAMAVKEKPATGKPEQPVEPKTPKTAAKVKEETVEKDVWSEPQKALKEEKAASPPPQPPPPPQLPQPAQPAEKPVAPEQAMASISPPAAAVGGKSKCPGGMAYIAEGPFKMGSATNDPMRGFGEKELTDVTTGPYCVDYYEYPNMRGEIPRTEVTMSEAAAMCGKKGKRLCTEDEWEKACKGLGSYRYPYGNKFEANKCNTIEAGTNAMATSGSFVMCRSGYGVYDLSGNAAEWTASSASTNVSDKVVRGGDAQKPNWGSRCAGKTNRNPASRDGFIGFRCCAEPVK